MGREKGRGLIAEKAFVRAWVSTEKSAKDCLLST